MRAGMPKMATRSTVHICTTCRRHLYLKKMPTCPDVHAARPFVMGLHIRINKRRVAVHPTSSEHEIFQKVTSKLAWPRARAFMEWGEGCAVEIRNDDELRLACRMLSEELFSEVKDWDTELMEKKIQQHMAEPDSEPEDKVCSDDDMTMEDFYMMGFRHEIYN